MSDITSQKIAALTKFNLLMGHYEIEPWEVNATLSASESRGEKQVGGAVLEIEVLNPEVAIYFKKIAEDMKDPFAQKKKPPQGKITLNEDGTMQDLFTKLEMALAKAKHIPRRTHLLPSHRSRSPHER